MKTISLSIDELVEIARQARVSNADAYTDGTCRSFTCAMAGYISYELGDDAMERFAIALGMPHLADLELE